MTATAGEWGPNLYRHLEAHWHNNGVTPRAWAEQHGFQPSTVMRWGQGAQPRLEQMQDVAAAIDATILDVLLVAGVVDAKDVKRGAPATPVVSAPEIAIRADATLDDWQKKHLLDFLASIRDVAARADRERPTRTTTGRKTRS